MARVSVVVLGGSGFVGSRIAELWSDDCQLSAPTHAELDVLDQGALWTFLEQASAPLVLNLAAWADVDGAEVERDDRSGRVFQLNAVFPGRLAEQCASLGKYLLHVSTDYVFDGMNSDRPYREDDPTGPLCWYAITKCEGERGVLATQRAGVARIEMPFSGCDYPKRDLARTLLSRLQMGQPFAGVTDQRITPIFLDDAGRALRLLLEARQPGIFHVAATDWTTPYAFARAIAQRLGLDGDLIQPESFETFALKRPARRPQHSWLDVSHYEHLFGPSVLHSVDAQLDQWAAQYGLGASGGARPNATS